MSKQQVQHTIPHPTEEFVQLFTRYQRRIFLFILGQVPNPTDAEEVLQETNIVMLRKCDQFQLGTNFLAWACSVARYEILKYRDRHKRDRLTFAKCIGALTDSDRRLIQLRYSTGSNGQNVAEAVGRPANSVYQSLSRIRRVLLECVNRKVASESPQ